MTFTVFPKLPSLQIPPNRQDILSNHALRSYHLANPDLGGAVDLLLNVDDSHSIITGQSFRIDGLLALPTCLVSLQTTHPRLSTSSLHGFHTPHQPPGRSR